MKYRVFDNASPEKQKKQAGVMKDKWYKNDPDDQIWWLQSMIDIKRGVHD